MFSKPIFTHIKNQQTRDAYYDIYKVSNHDILQDGYYYFNDEINYTGYDNYVGPYKTLDDVCKASYRHFVAIMSL